MKRQQFLSRLRRYCRKSGIPLQVDEIKGKGSHIVVIVGDKRTVVQSGELKPPVVSTLLKQLDLPPDALK